MSAELHDPGAELVGAYVLGLLEPAEVAEVERHLSGCASCRREVAELRELEGVLGEVPPEFLIDGPPEGGDLLLQRTLRRARRERGSEQVRRRAWLGAGAVAAAAAVLAVGLSVGRGTAPEAPPVAVGPVPSASTGSPPPAGTRTAALTDPTTGARMTVTVTPAMGWVRVNAAVAGLPPGERCHLVVNGRSGAKADAGSWLVSPAGAKAGTTLNGSALVDPADVASVSVVNESGTTFVTVPV
ncbi:zf-HC2 domain-containing protein [Kitasatospora paracochleata]|uniref:Putative zinc-finger domain-containing protein n=1 Tax=Kitasatospora paracochleata TaxID=58354 RepID=A0ABT1J1N2_9ACTN|nr:zf-HC2 domain-containing protein [Kitasatospora paracochleata]MCP2311283.1 hypothetical protein [Kitasatospora paracochleata]